MESWIAIRPQQQHQVAQQDELDKADGQEVGDVRERSNDFRQKSNGEGPKMNGPSSLVGSFGSAMPDEEEWLIEFSEAGDPVKYATPTPWRQGSLANPQSIHESDINTSHTGFSKLETHMAAAVCVEDPIQAIVGVPGHAVNHQGPEAWNKIKETDSDTERPVCRQESTLRPRCAECKEPKIFQERVDGLGEVQ